MARGADQRGRHAGQVFPGGRKIEPAEVGVLGEELVDRGVVAVPGNPPGDFADLAGRAAVHLGHFAERAPQLEGVVVGYHRGAGHGVAPEHVGQHVVALVPGKIEIDVGRVLPLGIEEPLEQEPGAERLHVGDAETVGDDRVGDRAPAAVGGAVLHDVAHHQEIVGEALHPDDGELVLQAVAGDGGDDAITPFGACIRQRAQLLQRVGGLDETRWHDPVADRDPVAAPFGDLAGPVDGVGHIGEVATELGSWLEPGLGGGWADRRTGGLVLLSVQDFVPCNGNQELVSRPVFRVGKAHRVGHYRGEAQAPRRGQHRVALLAGHQLGVEVGGAARCGDAG